MKILVTGSTGQLGTNLIRCLGRLEHKEKHEIIGATRKELDITDNKEVLEYFKNNSFDAVINAAAYTDVDKCETDFDNAFLVNAIGPRNLAIAAYKYGFKLIHISTDYVFDGKNPDGYYEFDRPNPISKYAITKFAGEEYVKNHCTQYFIIRTSWLYGKYGKNFVKTMLTLSESREEIKVVNDQKGSPTFSEDLVDFISKIITTEKYGIYHFSNSGSCTWYEFAKEIFKITNKDMTVHPISTEEFNAPAPRPQYSILNNYMAKLEFDHESRSWQEALQEYLIRDRSQGTGDSFI